MMVATVGGFERKAALGRFTHEEFIAGLELVQARGEGSFGNKLEEKLDLVFRWRRDDGIRALDAFAISLHAECGVLAGEKVEVLSRVDAEPPEIGREVSAMGDARAIKLVVRSRHL